MPSAEKISVTMTPEMMQDIRASVAPGEYALTCEAMRDAVRARVRQSAQDPRPSLTLDQVQQSLKTLHEETVKGHGRATV